MPRRLRRRDGSGSTSSRRTSPTRRIDSCGSVRFGAAGRWPEAAMCVRCSSILRRCASFSADSIVIACVPGGWIAPACHQQSSRSNRGRQTELKGRFAGDVGYAAGRSQGATRAPSPRPEDHTARNEGVWAIAGNGGPMAVLAPPAAGARRTLMPLWPAQRRHAIHWTPCRRLRALDHDRRCSDFAALQEIV